MNFKQIWFLCLIINFLSLVLNILNGGIISSVWCSILVIISVAVLFYLIGIHEGTKKMIRLCRRNTK